MLLPFSWDKIEILLLLLSILPSFSKWGSFFLSLSLGISWTGEGQGTREGSIVTNSAYSSIPGPRMHLITFTARFFEFDTSRTSWVMVRPATFSTNPPSPRSGLPCSNLRIRDSVALRFPASVAAYRSTRSGNDTSPPCSV